MVTKEAATAGPGMVTQEAAAAGPELPARLVTEREARFLPGLRMLVAGIVLLLAGVAVAVAASHQSPGAAAALVLLAILIFIHLLVVLCSEQATQPVVNTGTLCQ
jgi:hypothetical protein